jgi:DNA-directed RNA polymerase specialized sigma24 family protein
MSPSAQAGFFIFRAMPRYEFAETTEPDEFWQMLTEADRLWFETAEDREARYRRAELAERVRDAIHQHLSGRQREIMLAYLEFGSVSRAAEKIGVSETTGRYHFRRAIEALKGLML